MIFLVNRKGSYINYNLACDTLPPTKHMAHEQTSDNLKYTMTIHVIERLIYQNRKMCNVLLPPHQVQQCLDLIQSPPSGWELFFPGHHG